MQTDARSRTDNTVLFNYVNLQTTPFIIVLPHSVAWLCGYWYCMTSSEHLVVKKTYLSRSKRKDTSSSVNSASEEEEETEDVTMSEATGVVKPPSKVAVKPNSKVSTIKPLDEPATQPDTGTPVSEPITTKTPKKTVSSKGKEIAASPGRAPKKVEVQCVSLSYSPQQPPEKVSIAPSLPGPGPRTTGKTETPGASAKKTHIRSMSSISSLKQVADDASATESPSSKKPVSSVNRKRFATPDTVDDATSVAESSMGAGTIRRTEAERIEYFNNQPDCSDIEPHSVTCTRCKKVVNLGRKQTYRVKPWETHRQRCDQKVSATEYVQFMPYRVALTVHIRDDAQSELRSEAGTTKRSNTRHSVEQRKAILESDERAKTVLPDKVLCRKCDKWIRLAAKSEYALSNWNAHQTSCGGAVVSHRVAMATRKIQLVNDSQASSSGPRHVDCRFCGITVELDGDADYTLTNWESHKQTCTSPSKSGRATKAPQERSPASEEAPEAEASHTRGTKRGLDEPDLDVADPDARAPNRARKESYEPVNKAPPSVLGWFLMPFKAFMHGYQQSMAS
ncbi:unnamed protein product [Mycena citricolor]|uniref:Uncharacterized protein n=1 Tax=Mycena citricolor TaxID=2018698 RepID=A0AAD2JXS5_9AGAR|nr:unnamed protein product [Mycena citricolor]